MMPVRPPWPRDRFPVAPDTGPLGQGTEPETGRASGKPTKISVG